jgi:hypothetical protein
MEEYIRCALADSAPSPSPPLSDRSSVRRPADRSYVRRPTCDRLIRPSVPRSCLPVAAHVSLIPFQHYFRNSVLPLQRSSWPRSSWHQRHQVRSPPLPCASAAGSPLPVLQASEFTNGSPGAALPLPCSLLRQSCTNVVHGAAAGGAAGKPQEQTHRMEAEAPAQLFSHAYSSPFLQHAPFMHSARQTWPESTAVEIAHTAGSSGVEPEERA